MPVLDSKLDIFNFFNNTKNEKWFSLLDLKKFYETYKGCGGNGTHTFEEICAAIKFVPIEVTASLNKTLDLLKLLSHEVHSEDKIKLNAEQNNTLTRYFFGLTNECTFKLN